MRLFDLLHSPDSGEEPGSEDFDTVRLEDKNNMTRYNSEEIVYILAKAIKFMRNMTLNGKTLYRPSVPKYNFMLKYATATIPIIKDRCDDLHSPHARYAVIQNANSYGVSGRKNVILYVSRPKCFSTLNFEDLLEVIGEQSEDDSYLPYVLSVSIFYSVLNMTDFYLDKQIGEDEAKLKVTTLMKNMRDIPDITAASNADKLIGHFKSDLRDCYREKVKISSIRHELNAYLLLDENSTLAQIDGKEYNVHMDMLEKTLAIIFPEKLNDPNFVNHVYNTYTILELGLLAWLNFFFRLGETTIKAKKINTMLDKIEILHNFVERRSYGYGKRINAIDVILNNCLLPNYLDDVATSEDVLYIAKSLNLPHVRMNNKIQGNKDYQTLQKVKKSSIEASIKLIESLNKHIGENTYMETATEQYSTAIEKIDTSLVNLRKRAKVEPTDLDNEDKRIVDTLMLLYEIRVAQDKFVALLNKNTALITAKNR